MLQKKYMGWSNKDTYLYSLSIDNNETEGFNKVIRIAKKSIENNIKKSMLINVINNIDNPMKLDINKVDYEEIIETYKKEKSDSLTNTGKQKWSMFR